MTPSALYEAAETVLPALNVDLEIAFGPGGGERNAGRFVDLHLQLAIISYIASVQRGRDWSPVGWLRRAPVVQSQMLGGANSYASTAQHLTAALEPMQRKLIGRTKPGVLLAKASYIMLLAELSVAPAPSTRCHIAVPPLSLNALTEISAAAARTNGNWRPMLRAGPLTNLLGWADGSAHDDKVADEIADPAIDAALSRLGVAGLIGCEDTTASTPMIEQLDGYMLQNRPALLRGVLDGWPPFQRWQRQELLQKHGGLLVNVASVAYPTDFGEGATTMTLRTYAQQVMDRANEYGPDLPPPYVFHSVEDDSPLSMEANFARLLGVVSTSFQASRLLRYLLATSHRCFFLCGRTNV